MSINVSNPENAGNSQLRISGAEMEAAIATKEPTIQEGPLSQSKVVNLEADLEARTSTSQVSALLQNRATLADLAAVDQRLSSAPVTKASSELQARHPLITTAAPLSQSLVQGLEEALSIAAASAEIADGALTIAKIQSLREELDARVTTSALSNTLAHKQNLRTEAYPLPQAHVSGLEAALASKLSSLIDVEGAGSSPISSGSQLRRIYGDG